MTDMLAKAKLLNEKRTQGRWKAQADALFPDSGLPREHFGRGPLCWPNWQQAENDAAFIAFAPEFFDHAIPVLEHWKQVVELLVGENEKLKKQNLIYEKNFMKISQLSDQLKTFDWSKCGDIGRVLSHHFHGKEPIWPTS